MHPTGSRAVNSLKKVRMMEPCGQETRALYKQSIKLSRLVVSCTAKTSYSTYTLHLLLTLMLCVIIQLVVALLLVGRSMSWLLDL